MKRCPFCAEEIQDAAVKCRFCQSALESSEVPAERSGVVESAAKTAAPEERPSVDAPKMSMPLLVFSGAVALLGVVMFFERGFFASTLFGANALGNVGLFGSDASLIKATATVGGIVFAAGLLLASAAIRKTTSLQRGVFVAVVLVGLFAMMLYLRGGSRRASTGISDTFGNVSKRLSEPPPPPAEPTCDEKCAPAKARCEADCGTGITCLSDCQDASMKCWKACMEK